MKRLFLALPINIGNEFSDLFSDLKKKLAYEKYISWSNPKQIHLTLKFIGECTNEDEGRIIETLEKTLAHHHGFELDFNRIGLFGSRYKPRVLWIGMDNTPSELSALAEDVLSAFDSIGFQRTSENFVPHLTLCRIKKLCDKGFFHTVIDNIEQKSYINQTADKVILYRSILDKAGAIHKVEHVFTLK